LDFGIFEGSLLSYVLLKSKWSLYEIGRPNGIGYIYGTSADIGEDKHKEIGK
jgi:hypothetical protein